MIYANVCQHVWAVGIDLEKTMRKMFFTFSTLLAVI